MRNISWLSPCCRFRSPPGLAQGRGNDRGEPVRDDQATRGHALDSPSWACLQQNPEAFGGFAQVLRATSSRRRGAAPGRSETPMSAGWRRPGREIADVVLRAYSPIWVCRSVGLIPSIFDRQRSDECSNQLPMTSRANCDPARLTETRTFRCVVDHPPSSPGVILAFYNLSGPRTDIADHRRSMRTSSVRSARQFASDSAASTGRAHGVAVDRRSPARRTAR